jgi:hypothetical protein
MEWSFSGDHRIEAGQIWIVDARRDNGKRFVAHADEKLTALMKLRRHK